MKVRDFSAISIEWMAELSEIILDLLKRAFQTVDIKFNDEEVAGQSNPYDFKFYIYIYPSLWLFSTKFNAKL